MARKPRSDAKLKSLPPHQRELLIRWLVDENLAYDKAKERLEEDFGVETSIGALSEFYRTECFTLRSSEAKAFAEHVVETAQQDGDKYDEATLAIIRQRAFEIAYARDGKMDDLEVLARIIGDSRKHALKERQLEFSREKFRQQIKSDIEKGLDALHAEIKGNKAALQLFEKLKAVVMQSVGGAA